LKFCPHRFQPCTLYVSLSFITESGSDVWNNCYVDPDAGLFNDTLHATVSFPHADDLQSPVSSLQRRRMQIIQPMAALRISLLYWTSGGECVARLRNVNFIKFALSFPSNRNICTSAPFGAHLGGSSLHLMTVSTVSVRSIRQIWLRYSLWICIRVCKIWGFHGGDYDEWRLLGCYTVWLL
jgi:hypothetical protein